MSNRRHTVSSSRPGISLVEILISMFVLLFGLMGVAAIFPVGNHYAIEGEKFDMGNSLSQNAFEELRSRGMLKPELWHYPDPSLVLAPETATQHYPNAGEFDFSFIQPATIDNGDSGNPDEGLFNISQNTAVTPIGPGHAFVIDPLGAAAGIDLGLQNLDVFPYGDGTSTDYLNNYWNTGVPVLLSGTRWPIRRLTVFDVNGLMSTSVAETIFRLRDDLTVEQPKENDVPSWQTWDTDSLGNAIVADDILLRRQYTGNYSWLATLVPQSFDALAGLQPRALNGSYQQYRYDLSVVVFRKRDTTFVDSTGKTSERLISAELDGDSNLVVYSDARPFVDNSLEDIRSGNWIALAGVNQTTGMFMLQWYRIITMDTETLNEADAGYDVATTSGSFFVRRLMLDGPAWPVPPSTLAATNGIATNLRAIILPGAISVASQEVTMEGGSLHSLD